MGLLKKAFVNLREDPCLPAGRFEYFVVKGRFIEPQRITKEHKGTQREKVQIINFFHSPCWQGKWILAFLGTDPGKN